MAGKGSFASIPLVTTNDGVVLALGLARSSSFGIAHLATVYRLTTEICGICQFVLADCFQATIQHHVP